MPIYFINIFNYKANTIKFLIKNEFEEKYKFLNSDNYEIRYEFKILRDFKEKEDFEEKFNYFTKNIWQNLYESFEKHTIIFVSSSFDYNSLDQLNVSFH